ncbi:class I SAM-dependent methyltransferase [Paenibacillus sp. TRM 82003]|nr:class I SAM-dependent methyltransferase [Paenibacillus sp. TRM 82003]
MMIQLSKRLTAVAEHVLPGGVLADIGTDHALLPTYLVQRGAVPAAVAGDIHAGPVQAAMRQVEAAGLSNRISVRAGDGLAVLEPGEADTVAIAGMGGGTMVDILTSGTSSLQGVSRLVLQPNIGERLVREWLLDRGWVLVSESLLEEDGLLYEVIAADYAEDRAAAHLRNEALYTKHIAGYGEVPKPILLLMGPMLLSAPTPVFFEKWQAYVRKLDVLLEQIGKSEQPEALRKREAFRWERDQISEVLSCLSG